MTTVTLKVLTMKDEETARRIRELVSRLSGVQRVDVNFPVQSIRVGYDPKVTTITAMRKLLDVNFHKVAVFGRVPNRSLLNPIEKGIPLRSKWFVP